MRTSVVGFLPIVLVVACSDSSTPGATSCPAGQVVNGVGGCIKTCTATADCLDPGLECSVATGLCIPVSRACGPGRPCEPGKECNSFGECVAPTEYPCVQASDCPANMGCTDGQCVAQQCIETLCPPGFVCPASGVDCVAVEGFCQGDGDCQFGERCDNGTCRSLAGNIVQTCTTDLECGLGMTCQLGVCLGCLADLQCAPDGRCVLGSCVIAQLPPAVNCLTAQCQSGERCNPLTGVCEIPCTSAADCGTTQTCVPVAGVCIDYVPCKTDADCPGALTCAVGVCIGCNAVEVCPAGTTCQLENPVTGGGACLPDLGTIADPCAGVSCGTGQACDPYDGSCYNTNGTCQADGNCRPGHTCSFLGFCAGCSVDGDCRPGQHCRFGTCSPL